MYRFTDSPRGRFLGLFCSRPANHSKDAVFEAMDRELGEAWRSHNGEGGVFAAPTNGPKIMANQNSFPMMVDSS